MSARKQLRTLIQRESAEWLDRQPARLGDGTGSDGGVVLTQVPGTYNARLVNGRVVKVYNQAHVSPKPDLQVTIGRRRSEPGVWQIIRVDQVYEGPADTGIEYHHEQHEEGGADRGNFDRKQIRQLSVRVEGDPTDFIVRIEGAIVVTDDYDIVAHQNLDLSAHVVTTGALLVGIESDDDGVITANPGTPFAARDAATKADLPTLSAGQHPIAVVSFYESQTELADADIVAVLSLPSAGGGGGAVDSVNGYTGVVVLDPDDLDDSATTNKFVTAAEISKLAGIETGAEVNNISDANATELTDGSETTLHSHPGREFLTADRTYYVRTDGDDANTGLVNSAGGAFLTVQKAVDVASALDNGGFSITIQIADGTYTGKTVLKSFLGSGKIIIQGNSGTPANVLISVTSATPDGCFYGDAVLGVYQIKDMELRTTTDGSCIMVGKGTKIEYGNIRFGACASSHVRSFEQGAVSCISNYSITGNAARHWYAGDAGTIIITTGLTITLSATPAFSSTFAEAERMGYMKVNALTFTGSATGQRYIAEVNGAIFTNGAGGTYLPGNSAGSTATGGIYA